MGIHRLRSGVVFAVAALMLLVAADAGAQWRIGSDSATRLTRLGRALAYGTITGLGFAAVDQWQTDPPEWGKSWPGFGRRAASNVGQFYIQEGVTEGLAFAMRRPLDYTRCTCTATGDRAIWAVQGAYLDQLPSGKRVVAVPRIVGAFVGSFAQAAWRPSGGNDRLMTGLVDGATSLGLGALINMYYEFRHQKDRSSTMAGDRR
jgi:hypothetical protein